MKLIYHSCLFLLIIFLSACETPISLTIPHHKNPLVIEGWIDNDRPATVIVSRSLSYYTEITLATILQSIDTTAQVIVSDDEGNSETLSLGFSADHLYGLLGKAYVGKNIKGKIVARDWNWITLAFAKLTPRLSVCVITKLSFFPNMESIWLWTAAVSAPGVS